MKKTMLFTALCFLLLTGCAATTPAESTPANENAPAPAVLSPLPDATLENLTDAILAVSLEKGGVYADETGALQMALDIYTYDKYDMVDISTLKVGDTIIRTGEEVTVESMERDESGTIYINGGLDAGGFDLVTDDSGIFYEMGYNDAKNWYKAGNSTFPISANFQGTDNSDPEKANAPISTADLLTANDINYQFGPHNTTVRTENGQIVALERRYTP